MSASGFFPNPSTQSPTPASNQYFPTLPSLTGSGGGIPLQSNLITGGSASATSNPPASTYTNPSSDPLDTFSQGTKGVGHGIIETNQQYPALGQGLVNYLMSQIGQGISPFNQSTALPTGGSTTPGALSAPVLDSLNTIANEGISALPEWQAMIAAMGQNTAQNEAQLKEQFASTGGLAGTPYGNAVSNFQQQTTLDQNALLGQLQQTNILQGQIPVAQFLQNYDQSAVDKQYQQFQTDQAQNNPLLSLMAQLSSLYPPTNQNPTGVQNAEGLLGAISGAIGTITKPPAQP